MVSGEKTLRAQRTRNQRADTRAPEHGGEMTDLYADQIERVAAKRAAWASTALAAATRELHEVDAEASARSPPSPSVSPSSSTASRAWRAGRHGREGSRVLVAIWLIASRRCGRAPRRGHSCAWSVRAASSRYGRWARIASRSERTKRSASWSATTPPKKRPTSSLAGLSSPCDLSRPYVGTQGPYSALCIPGSERFSAPCSPARPSPWYPAGLSADARQGGASNEPPRILGAKVARRRDRKPRLGVRLVACVRGAAPRSRRATAGVTRRRQLPQPRARRRGQRANENLAKRESASIPARLTLHSLRRTFASLLYALGESPPVVMAEMGHTDPALALRVYAQTMRCGQGEQEALGALVDGTGADEGAEFRPIEADGADSGLLSVNHEA